jgi:hypothetical protein
MYTQKNIVYVLRYDFENDQTIKPRYLIVIDNNNTTSLVLSLVTSKDHIPDNLMKHGCINEPDRMIHCHVFLSEKIIGENGFSFPLNSFIFEKYQDKVEVKDRMTDDEFSNLIYCIYKSKYISRGIKKRIEVALNDLTK